jgi:hypothetical protein
MKPIEIQLIANKSPRVLSPDFPVVVRFGEGEQL